MYICSKLALLFLVYTTKKIYDVKGYLCISSRINVSPCEILLAYNK